MNQYNITNLSVLQKQKKNGQDSSRFLILLFQVSMVHALFIVVPYLYFSLDYLWTKPKPVVLKVGLVDLPKGNTTTKTTANTPSSEDTQDFLDQFSDPAQPGKVPPPLPVEEPVAKPKPEPQKPKTEQPPKKQPPKKQPPKEQPKTQERQYLSADQIIKSGKRSNNKEEIRKQQEAAAKAARAAQDRQKALDEIINAVSGGDDTKDQEDQENEGYYGKLTNYIFPKWKEPAGLQLDGKDLVIKLYITIEHNGMVSACSFTPTGNIAMDESVKALCELLKRSPVPAPPERKGMKIWINLEAKNKK